MAASRAVFAGTSNLNVTVQSALTPPRCLGRLAQRADLHVSDPGEGVHGGRLLGGHQQHHQRQRQQRVAASLDLRRRRYWRSDIAQGAVPGDAGLQQECRQHHHRLQHRERPVRCNLPPVHRHCPFAFRAGQAVRNQAGVGRPLGQGASGSLSRSASTTALDGELVHADRGSAQRHESDQRSWVTAAGSCTRAKPTSPRRRISARSDPPLPAADTKVATLTTEVKDTSAPATTRSARLHVEIPGCSRTLEHMTDPPLIDHLAQGRRSGQNGAKVANATDHTATPLRPLLCTDGSTPILCTTFEVLTCAAIPSPGGYPPCRAAVGGDRHRGNRLLPCPRAVQAVAQEQDRGQEGREAGDHRLDILASRTVRFSWGRHRKLISSRARRAPSASGLLTVCRPARPAHLS